MATFRAHRDLHELVRPSEPPHIDWLGNLLFAAGLTLVLLGITLGALGNLPGDGGLAMALVGLAVLGGFLWVEAREASPMLDLSLFRIRAFSATATATLLNALARGAFTFVLVFYLQGPPRFLNPFTAGLFLIPVSASLATFGPVSGWLSDRWGPRWFVTLGLVVTAVGFL
ncbi:multidrug resistance protein, partial [mine drainage metagenome]